MSEAMTPNRAKSAARSRILLKVGAIITLALAALAGLHLWDEPPPSAGAVLNFTSTIPDVNIQIRNAKDQSGRPFLHAGSFGPSLDPINGGKAMGGAPGTLPIWVEFTWQELPYPGRPREAFSTYETWSAYVDEVYRAAPLKTARVEVEEKIPATALEEVARSRAGTPSNELPDKMLWLYFIWTTDGIKVRWKVSSATDIKKDSEGGDSL